MKTDHGANRHKVGWAMAAFIPTGFRNRLQRALLRDVSSHLSRMGTVRFDSPQVGEVEPRRGRGLKCKGRGLKSKMSSMQIVPTPSPGRYRVRPLPVGSCSQSYTIPPGEVTFAGSWSVGSQSRVGYAHQCHVSAKSVGTAHPDKKLQPGSVRRLSKHKF